MKKQIFGLLIALLITVLPLTACTNEEDFTVTDCVFSSFTAEDYDGNIVDESVFSEYKVTMINVWGSYCEPCKRELPALAELNAEYENFQVIGIPIDNTNLTATLMKDTANYRHLKISTSLKGFISEIKSIPYTIFINQNGEQIGKAYIGAKTKTEWKKIIKPYV